MCNVCAECCETVTVFECVILQTLQIVHLQLSQLNDEHSQVEFKTQNQLKQKKHEQCVTQIKSETQNQLKQKKHEQCVTQIESETQN